MANSLKFRLELHVLSKMKILRSFIFLVTSKYDVLLDAFWIKIFSELTRTS